jgi:hypothetical protein
MTSKSRCVAIVVIAAVLIAVVAVAGIVLAQPRGLASRPVSSVPALLSEPAGVPGAGLVLAPNGLGAVSFGEPEPSAMTKLIAMLGAPAEDGPQPCSSETDVVRWVRWGNLSVAFPDGSFGGYISGIYFPPDSPELQIKTVEGAALRMNGDELSAIYGDRLAWTGQEESGFGQPVDAFGIDGFDVNHPKPTGIGGFVEGGRQSGQVITIFAGQPCGPR